MHETINQATAQIIKIKTSKFSLIPLIALITASLLLMAGCATNQLRLVLDPVGPPPGLPSAGGSKGSLIVFSAFDVYIHFGMDRHQIGVEPFGQSGQNSPDLPGTLRLAASTSDYRPDRAGHHGDGSGA
jgi:hypothetical protein